MDIDEIITKLSVWPSFKGKRWLDEMLADKSSSWAGVKLPFCLLVAFRANDLIFTHSIQPVCK